MFNNPYAQRPWHARSRFIRQRARARWATFFPVALVALSLSACDSGGSNEPDLNGMWERRSADAFYVEITSSHVRIVDYLGDDVDEGSDCYVTRYDFTVVSRDDDELRLRLADGRQTTLQVDHRGDELDLTEPDGDTMPLRRSAKKASSFTPVCND